ncbi:hypothetical protein [Cysteiniphilum litorale]|uniref:hypothetical protein n=1 Tax=Cysteiniphilum litorale TaxID=2056700 RepID=UPI003F8841BD
MKRNLKLLISFFIIDTLFLLSACGGGGQGNDNQPAQKATNAVLNVTPSVSELSSGLISKVTVTATPPQQYQAAMATSITNATITSPQALLKDAYPNLTDYTIVSSDCTTELAAEQSCEIYIKANDSTSATTQYDQGVHNNSLVSTPLTLTEGLAYVDNPDQDGIGNDLNIKIIGSQATNVTLSSKDATLSLEQDDNSCQITPITTPSDNYFSHFKVTAKATSNNTGVTICKVKITLPQNQNNATSSVFGIVTLGSYPNLPSYIAYDTTKNQYGALCPSSQKTNDQDTTYFTAPMFIQTFGQGQTFKYSDSSYTITAIESGKTTSVLLKTQAEDNNADDNLYFPAEFMNYPVSNKQGVIETITAASSTTVTSNGQSAQCNIAKPIYDISNASELPIIIVGKNTDGKIFCQQLA